MASWHMGFSMGWKVARNVICCNDDFFWVKHVIADSFVFFNMLLLLVLFWVCSYIVGCVRIFVLDYAAVPFYCVYIIVGNVV